MIVCVPYRRGGSPTRERNWATARTRWEQWGFTVHTGDSPGEWKTARARNIAARDAGDWGAAIFADADILLEQSTRALEAIVTAAETGAYTVCYSELHYHDYQDRVYHRATGPWICCFAIRRDLFDLIGGFDERFPGNDNEDICLLDAATTLGPPPQRVQGVAHHLWHPPRKDRIIGGELAQRYKDARGNREMMQALVTERTA